MPRFVVLRHEPSPDGGRSLHWDLMLEQKNVLLTWALASVPLPGEAIRAQQLFDHRKAYLEYEGPISGGRGEVERWDQGEFKWLVEGEDQLTLELSGAKLRCRAILSRRAGDDWVAQFMQRDP